jgi:PAS domain S-box-containing protein
LTENIDVSTDELMKIFLEVIKDVSAGVYVRDLKSGTIVTCNAAFAQIHGFKSIDEILGKISWDFIDAEDAIEAKKQLAEKGFFVGEVFAFTQTKERRTISLTAIAVPPMHSVIGIVRDITEKKVIEDKLRESEAKYRALVDTIREGLIIVDSAENFAFSNPGFALSLGYKKSELIGRNLSEFTSDDQFKIILKNTEERKKGKTGYYKVSLRTKQSIVKEFLINAAPLFDANSTYAGAIAVVVESKKILGDLNRESESRGIFLTMLLSEISEQLLRAKGWLDILLSETSISEQKRKIEKVQSCLEKLENFSKQTSTLIPTSFDKPLIAITIPEFLDLLHERISHLIFPGSCTFETKLLIEKPESYKCPQILEYVIEQIVRDSVNRNSHSIKLEFSITDKNDFEISIIDDGKAIVESRETPEYLMGLYVADELIKQIGGKMMFSHSIPGKEINFKLILPYDSSSV